MISNEFRGGNLAAGNWQLAVGTFYKYGIADVCVGPSTVEMEFTLWRWDPYEFDCDFLPYRPPGSIGHMHTANLVTDYVNEVAETRTLVWPR